ncbi:MAG: pilin [Gammaproteobacteria bacterium HGW-Gammaproteobacteria-14]|nr:MAG: pilin [Gammaproteobacteria bacterium HGW-Gammaproteobacteria-14]
MKNVQKGFSLIELMIVVAIIGILAAIAVPAYQDFVARGQAGEGLTATSGFRAEVNVHLSELGVLPDAGDSQTLDDTLAEVEGRYFSVGNVVNSGAGVIEITFDDGVHAGQTMVLTPILNAAATQVASWECTGLAFPKYLPTACRP